jgi:TrmH family RNA methyltransferase
LKTLQITSRDNARFKQALKLQKSKGRREQGRFLIEGAKLIKAALAANVKLAELYLEENVAAEYVESFSHVVQSIYILPQNLIKELSQTTTPQGVIAVLEIPPEADRAPYLQQERGTYLLLDGLQDPGNLGTIIRTAAAMEATAIFLGHGSVDWLNEKVIRAAAGALWQLPIFYSRIDNLLYELRMQKITILSSDVAEGKVLSSYKFPAKIALIFGNEGQGVSDNLHYETDEVLHLPLGKNIESLNVSIAAAMFLYERNRQNIVG